MIAQTGSITSGISRQEAGSLVGQAAAVRPRRRVPEQSWMGRAEPSACDGMSQPRRPEGATERALARHQGKNR